MTPKGNLLCGGQIPMKAASSGVLLSSQTFERQLPLYEQPKFGDAAATRERILDQLLLDEEKEGRWSTLSY
jgi:hypothetical protein